MGRLSDTFLDVDRMQGHVVRGGNLASHWILDKFKVVKLIFKCHHISTKGHFVHTAFEI